jgi:hypothetical protein
MLRKLRCDVLYLLAHRLCVRGRREDFQSALQCIQFLRANQDTSRVGILFGDDDTPIRPRDLLVQFLENCSRLAGIDNLKRLGHSGSRKTPCPQHTPVV